MSEMLAMENKEKVEELTKGKKFSDAQKQWIFWGLKNGIDVELLAKEEYFPDEMQQMCYHLIIEKCATQMERNDNNGRNTTTIT